MNVEHKLAFALIKLLKTKNFDNIAQICDSSYVYWAIYKIFKTNRYMFYMFPPIDTHGGFTAGRFKTSDVYTRVDTFHAKNKFNLWTETYPNMLPVFILNADNMSVDVVHHKFFTSENKHRIICATVLNKLKTRKDPEYIYATMHTYFPDPEKFINDLTMI